MYLPTPPPPPPCRIIYEDIGVGRYFRTLFKRKEKIMSEKLNVKLVYKSEEPDCISSTVFILYKQFQFKQLPKIEANIILKDDAIDKLIFKNVEYDPDINEYFITMTTCEGVGRYYHGNAKMIMNNIIKRYTKHGWTVL